jgi:low affinity Fe/Cu permease
VIFYLFLPSIVIAALLVLALLHQFGLTVDYQLRIGDVVGVVSTTLIAVILQHVLARKNKSKDIERDMLLADIGTVLDGVRALSAPITAVVGIEVLQLQQSQNIIQAFEACADSLATLEIGLGNGAFQSHMEACQEAGNVLARTKQNFTGDNFPNRRFTYADLDRLRMFKQELVLKLRMLAYEIGKS